MREVCTLHSGRIAIHGNSIIASGGNTPTIVAVPRMARLSIARRTSTGQDSATDQRSAVERQFGVDLHQRVLVQQHLLGIARNADELPERLALLRQPRLRALGPRNDRADAQIRMAGKALRASAAK